MKAIGLMSGTSLDGIDAAVIESDGERIFRREGGLHLAYSPDFQERLRQVIALHAAPDWQSAVKQQSDWLAEIEQEIADIHAELVMRLCQQQGHGRVEVVGFHGQTVLHRPLRGTSNGVTRQIGNAERLARLIGIPVVHDFRSHDVSCGGEGAPLVPVYHQALARAAELPQPLVILNIGGVANITAISQGELIAFDTGPGVALIDEWVLRHTGQGFDTDGRLAAQGQVDWAAVARFGDHVYFAKPYPKSLDRNDFGQWVTEIMGGESHPANGAATLVAMTAAAVARSLALLPQKPQCLWVAGGGRHNLALLAELGRATGLVVRLVDDLGWDGDLLEAEAFGFLAIRHCQGLPLSFPNTTGVVEPCLGGRMVMA
ncbi:MAG: anhydro-N-acetylmuramic acid kinase [Candidatus Pacebacteria bacterium]|nr:anhydro-N-acetylmuramic acid kinase [Candidatus Paceibacterota bacterium]